MQAITLPGPAVCRCAPTSGRHQDTVPGPAILLRKRRRRKAVLPEVTVFLSGFPMPSNHAVPSMRAAPARQGTTAYQKPSCRICSPPVTAIRAVAPPGGCRVPLSSMTAMAVGTQRQMAQKGGSHYAQAPPTRAERKWPPSRLRGRDKGLSGAANSRTAEAPKEPISMGTP